MNKKLKISIFLLAALLVVSCGKKEDKTDKATTETSTTQTEEPKAEEKGKLSKEQQNLLVFGAVLASRNDMPYDELTPAEYKDASIQVLGSAWEVTDTASAKEQLDALLNEGHRKEGDVVLEKVKANAPADLKEQADLYNDVKKNLIDNYGYTEEEINNIKTISAWDYDRLVNVARFSYYAGYITEAEMWDYVNKAVDSAKKDYNGWKDYFAGAIIGRAISYGQGFADSADAADTLLKDNDSPYKKFSFK
ncbi:MAG: DUF1266 domain-containing protein [Sebaldella sp.]|nr:DUF1266 domain-containing protein [Sebaldella sp.]